MGEDKGKRDIYGLLGCNISYSLSPVMHNSAFRHFGIKAAYQIFDIKPSELNGFIEGIRRGGISGINITVPYKVSVMEILRKNVSDTVEGFAGSLGAVNTVRVSGGGLEGFNTDGPGFGESLKDDLGVSPVTFSGNKALILGAGGAGRAVSFYLLGSDLNLEKVFIRDTDTNRARALAGDINLNFGPGRAVAVDAEESALRALECVIIVNATPLGTKEGDIMPFPAEEQHTAAAALYDLVYARETELVRFWRSRGGRACGGLGMLVDQAALAFDIWTGSKYDLFEIKSVMRSSLPAEMKERYGWNIL